MCVYVCVYIHTKKWLEVPLVAAHLYHNTLPRCNTSAIHHTILPKRARAPFFIGPDSAPFRRFQQGGKIGKYLRPEIHTYTYMRTQLSVN